MKYNLKKDNFCEFSIFEDNKAAARAYFIPFPCRDEALRATPETARYNSSYVRVLSGEWDFAFFERPGDLPDELDTDTASFDRVAVPSVWQFTGYMQPAYLNTYYPFGCNPPVIPKGELGYYKLAYNRRKIIDGRGQYNSIGVYRRTFDVDDLSLTYTISFLGVSPCFDLFVNGKYVGYSEGSHNTAEFLLDDYLLQGANELVAVVHRWCNGTYLECQDMMRNNGIFRDVLLYALPKEHIHDFELRPVYKKGGSYDLNVTVYVAGYAGGSLSCEFLGNRVNVPVDENGVGKYVFDDVKPMEWSAETPNLYDVILELNGREYVKRKVGFKHIRIKGCVYYFNERKIKFKGVNHHDTNPNTGFVMTMEDMLTDIRLMKEYNVNAVRTSHYPPDPAFIEMCEIYGLYIVDEADIETHGVIFALSFNLISRNPEWKEHYLDRVKRMYMRDRNSPAIAMWSLGNESGGIKCQKYCYDYLKTVTDIPVHYEGASHCFIKGFDVVSEMYTSVGAMRRRAARRSFDHRRNKPYFLCEYAHAMGTGPGGLAEYMELFYSSDIYMGGCIWEWADHAKYHPDTGNYTYGGDHGEYVHSGTFCVDGLFTPDRKPYTSAQLMKIAYRPIVAKHVGKGKVIFTNTNRFLSSDYIEIVAKLAINGEEVNIKRNVLNIAPTESAFIKYTVPTKVDAFLNIEYYDRNTGACIASEQIPIARKMSDIPTLRSGMDYQEQDNKITFTFDNGLKAVFDRQEGCLSEYYVGDKQILNTDPTNRFYSRGFYTNIYRAPFDNEGYASKYMWKVIGYNYYYTGKVRCWVHFDRKVKDIVFRYTLRNGRRVLAYVWDIYSIHPDGQIVLETTLMPIALNMLPRFGKTIELEKEYRHVRYYGRGPSENYPDMKMHARVGIYEQDADFGTPMIVPQNSGEKCDVRWAEITNDEGVGIKIYALRTPLGINVNHYTQDLLSKWKHITDYADQDTTVVDIDGFVRGSGSNSCGPLPQKKYTLPHRTMTYRFAFLPIFGHKK